MALELLGFCGADSARARGVGGAVRDDMDCGFRLLDMVVVGCVRATLDAWSVSQCEMRENEKESNGTELQLGCTCHLLSNSHTKSGVGVLEARTQERKTHTLPVPAPSE